MNLLGTELFLVVAGVIVVAVAVTIARDATHPRRWGAAAFWLLLALLLIAGNLLPPVGVGYVLLVMSALVALRATALPRFSVPAPAALLAEAQRMGRRLLWPILVVPVVAITAGFVLPSVQIGSWHIVAQKEASLVGIGLGALAAMVLALRWTRDRPATAVVEGGRLLQLLGWTLLLPQMLAALGGLFARAGVGEEIARLVAAGLPVEHPLVAVVAYCGGMALFTILLGNAFAAFPVITLGVGLPFVVQQHGGNPAIMGVLGMVSGYCGTLVTPMAANFNLVPVRLLELQDDFAVIKAQAPMALLIWLFNVTVMALFVYPSS